MSNSNQNPAPGTPAASGTLVEETPLGLTSEQMSKSNPAAVNEIKADAQKEDRQRLADLRAAFPNDLDFALQSHDEGLTVAEAKAKAYDKVSPELKSLREENTTLKAQIEGGKVNLTMSDDKKTELKSTDEIEAEALKIWEADAALRSEFGGEKSAYLAAFKHDPDEFRKKK